MVVAGKSLASPNSLLEHEHLIEETRRTHLASDLQSNDRLGHVKFVFLNAPVRRITLVGLPWPGKGSRD